MPTVIIGLLVSSFSFATVSIRNVDCPVKFEGTVKEVVDGVGSSGAFATRSVVFKTNQVMKGEVSDQVVIEMLQYGPYQLESGEDYRVQLRDGHICQVEKL